MTDVAIVIVNYKMRDLALNCLSTLFNDLKSAPFTFHVTVVDNDSGDGVGEAVASGFPQVTFLQDGANLGYAVAVNNGIKSHAGRYYFVLNPDTRIVEPKTVERLWRFMEENPKAGMCAPKQRDFDGTFDETCYRFHSMFTPFARRTRFGATGFGKRELDHYLMRDWHHGKDRLVEWVLGSAMFVRAAAVDVVGLMDERFFLYFEDTDWCRRFWDAGWPIYYVPSITLEHAHRRTSAAMSVWRGVFMSKSTRYHVASWIKYLAKYRLKRM